METPPVLKEWARTVDARLEALLPQPDGLLYELHAAMRYSALAPGKRVRPVLCLLSAEAVGSDPLKALDGACALEMVHAFSLIHDDLPALDDDRLRRGRPTCHVEFGEAVAILAGDALFALAFQVMAELNAPADRVLAAIGFLTRSVGSNGLVGGETVDVLSEGKISDQETVEFIHTRKTGALIAAACGIGAVLGGGSPEQVEALYGFGADVGLAFQIADDVLNETGTAEQLGKAAGSDKDRAKATYPAVMGLEAAKRAGQAVTDRGMARLAAFGSAAQPLKELAQFVMDRQS